MLSKPGILTIILTFCLPATAQSEGMVPEPPVDDTVSGSIARVAFTTQVVEHEPVDRLESIPEGLEEVYFFSEFVDMSGESVLHRWLYDGEVVAEIPIEIGGPRWRAYSIKTIEPEWNRNLVVQVIGGEGQVLEQAELSLGAQTELSASAPDVESGS